MNIHRPKKRQPVVAIIPLLDILTILLIFFVATTTFKTPQPKVEIDLPEGEQIISSEDTIQHTYLTLSDDGMIYLNEVPIEADEIGVRLSELKLTQPHLKLAIRPDKDAPVGKYFELWEQLTASGISMKEVPTLIQKPVSE